MKVRQQAIKLFSSTPTVPLYTKPEHEQKVKSDSAKLAKKLAKRDKKLLEAAQLQRESMAKVSEHNQAVISKLQVELEKVLEKRKSAKPDTKRVRKRDREQVSLHTTADPGPKVKPLKVIP